MPRNRLAVFPCAALLLAGCTTYGSPPDHAPVAPKPAPTCIVEVRNEYGEIYKRYADRLLESLTATGWFREVGEGGSLSAAPDIVVTPLDSQLAFNEPYLAVLTFGVAPNPLVFWHGSRFRLHRRTRAEREVDVAYRTVGFVGWFTGLIALTPRQSLAPPRDLYQSYFERLLIEHAPELAEPCGPQ